MMCFVKIYIIKFISFSNLKSMIIAEDIQNVEESGLFELIEEKIDCQQNQIENQDIKNSHNDNHIFYSLKAANNQNFEQSVFSVSIPSRQKGHRVRITSRQEFRQSLNLKNSQIQPAQIPNATEIQYKNSPSVHRLNKVIYFKDGQEQKAKIREKKLKPQNPQIDTSNDLGMKRKKQENKKRNKFNVKEFLQMEQKRKKEGNAMIMMKNTSSSMRKKAKDLGKIMLSPEKIKEFQFNAIDITKNIVEKNLTKLINPKINMSQRKSLLKANKSYNEGINVQKLLPQTKAFLDKSLGKQYLQQRGSLWRSNSYQLPRKKQIEPQQQSDEGKNLLFWRRSQHVRNDDYDSNIELKPWHHQITESHSMNMRQRYEGIKTEKQLHEDENQFLSYYIKTARTKREKLFD